MPEYEVTIPAKLEGEKPDTIRLGVSAKPETAFNVPTCEGNDFMPMVQQFESRILRTLQVPRVLILGTDESTSSAFIAQVMQKINDDSIREIGRSTARMMEQIMLPPLLKVVSRECAVDQIAWLKMIGKVSPKCERRRIGRTIRKLRREAGRRMLFPVFTHHLDLGL